MSFTVSVIHFYLLIIKMWVTNSHFRFQSRGITLSAITIYFLHLSASRNWAKWAPGTGEGRLYIWYTKSLRLQIWGTRTKGAGSQVVTTPGCIPPQHPKSKPLANNNSLQPASHAHSSCSQILWSLVWWPGAASQGQGFPHFPGQALQLWVSWQSRSYPCIPWPTATKIRICLS